MKFVLLLYMYHSSAFVDKESAALTNIKNFSSMANCSAAYSIIKSRFPNLDGLCIEVK